MKLKQSKVKFYEAEHQYWLGDKQLQGITGILSRQLFHSKYSWIDKSILDKAAEYGSMVHNDIELYDSLGGVGGDVTLPHLISYKKLMQENNLTVIDNEYLISDNVNYASCIDIVTKDLSLIDIKTTSKLDAEYISWQLSIYAYLFELQNSKLKVNKLYALWLPKPQYGNPKIVEVNRINAEEIIKLLDCDSRGEQYIPTITETSNKLSIAVAIEQSMLDLDTSIKELEAKRKMILDGILLQMQEYNIDNYKSTRIQLIRKHATERKSLDTKLLQAEHPEIYDTYLRVSPVKESIVFKSV